jgi:hypothetical protein
MLEPPERGELGGAVVG